MTESTPNVGKWRAIPREPRLIEAHATVLVCDDFGVDARLVLDGDFASDGERDAYVKQLLARLNEPSPKRREAIEADMRRGSRLTTHRLAVGNFGKPQPPPAQSPTPAVDDVKEPSPFYAASQASTKPERILFPTHLRKMWSGGEVQAWLDEQLGVTAPAPSAKGSLERYRQWQASQATPAPQAADNSARPLLQTHAEEVAAAWAECRAEVGAAEWTVSESFNYHGFFLHGWRAALASKEMNNG